MFGQQSTTARPAPGLSSNRLQNGKLGNNPLSGSSWPSNATSRNTFAQTLGANQNQQSSQAPLDLSDFPSLGTSNTQPNPATQNMWGSNQNVRTPGPTNTSSNRPDDFDSYRFSQRTQQNPTEDFPPLGDERRSNLLSSFNNQTGVGRLPFDQEQLIRGAADRNPTPRGRTLTNPNPFPIPENLGVIGSQSYGYLNSGTGTGANPGSGAGVGPRNGFSDSNPQDILQEPIGPGPIRSRPPGQQPPNPKKRLAEMSRGERFGLPGLIAKMDPDHPDYAPTIVGVDLNELGFDLNRPPSTPLFPTFGSPFGPPGQQESRPPIPDFTLPAAYKVTNVPPLHSKISSMSDDCLMFIFYSAPRDVAQELAAQELYTRDWRWHTKMKLWIHRDPSQLQNTIRRPNGERGIFIVFNPAMWRKERGPVLDLNYDDLEARHGQPQFNGPLQ